MDSRTHAVAVFRRVGGQQIKPPIIFLSQRQKSDFLSFYRVHPFSPWIAVRLFGNSAQSTGFGHGLRLNGCSLGLRGKSIDHQPRFFIQLSAEMGHQANYRPFIPMHYLRFHIHRDIRRKLQRKRIRRFQSIHSYRLGRPLNSYHGFDGIGPDRPVGGCFLAGGRIRRLFLFGMASRDQKGGCQK